MSKLGIIAGEGSLPIEFAKNAQKAGRDIVVFALKDVASKELENAADKVHWLNVGQYAKFAFLLLKHRVKEVALLGKVPKQLVYKSDDYEDVAKKALSKLDDNKDYSLLEEITKHLARFGVEVIDPRAYLESIIPKKGVLTSLKASEELKADIDFGKKVARELAGLDIGQTAVVKKLAVVSLEAMEGTDEVIKRSGRVAGDGCVMVKLSRPDQDMRWDIPVIGERTIKNLIEAGFSALVIESDKMFFIDKDELAVVAEQNGLYIEAV